MDYHVSDRWLVVIITLAIWEIIWKGIAMWKAATRSQLGWFVILLAINTVGLLPILYIMTSKGEDHDS